MHYDGYGLLGAYGLASVTFCVGAGLVRWLFRKKERRIKVRPREEDSQFLQEIKELHAKYLQAVADGKLDLAYGFKAAIEARLNIRVLTVAELRSIKIKPKDWQALGFPVL